MEFPDAIRLLSYHFPSGSITCMMVLSNMIIENSNYCTTSTANAIIALLIIFAVVTFCVRFTDAYQGTDKIMYTVVLIPFYGAVCPRLPTEGDKDLLYDYYYLTAGDYFHAAASTVTFVGVSLLMNPVDACVFPAYHVGRANAADLAKGIPNHNGHSYRNLSTSQLGIIVAAGPVFFMLLGMLWFFCIRPTRQMLGHHNCPDTVIPLLPDALPAALASNPAYDDDGNSLGSGQGPADLNDLEGGGGGMGQNGAPQVAMSLNRGGPGGGSGALSREPSTPAYGVAAPQRGASGNQGNNGGGAGNGAYNSSNAAPYNSSSSSNNNGPHSGGNARPPSPLSPKSSRMAPQGASTRY